MGFKMIAHRGRRGDSQIHRFEYQVGRVGKLNDLTTHQTQLLIVIKHSVHVLNPDSIHRSVKYQPFTVGRLEEVII